MATLLMVTRSAQHPDENLSQSLSKFRKFRKFQEFSVPDRTDVLEGFVRVVKTSSALKKLRKKKFGIELLFLGSLCHKSGRFW